MPHDSSLPPIEIPNIPLYNFLFTSPYSPLHPTNTPPSQLGSFISSPADTSLPYSTLPLLTTYFSTALSRLHAFTPGDVLACFAANSTWFPVPMWGVIRIGGVFCGNNPASEVGEMVYALRKSKAKFVVADEGSWGRVAEACREVGIPAERVFLLEAEDGGKGGLAGEEGVLGVRELCEIGKAWGARGQVGEYVLPEGASNGDLLGFLAFSSGTTGLPKAAMISHRNVIAQCLQIQSSNPHGTSEKGLAVLPFFHITGLILTLHVSLFVNRTLIILTPPFSLPNFLRTITLYKISILSLVPPLVLLLLNHPLVQTNNLTHVSRISSGAAPLSAETIAAIENKFPHTILTQGYGLTETTGCITATPYDRGGKAPKGSVGILIGSTQVRIVDQSGKEVNTGSEGEIRVRGPQCNTLGYLGDEAATRGLYDEDRWLMTGDWGYIDDDGWLFITDRVKEMIKVKGVQVAPAELEACLLGHPLIADSAVISMPHPYSGEIPLAFVVLKSGVQKTNPAELEREIIEYVKSRKSRPKWIEGGVRFVEEIPKNPSGKILRRVLRERVKAEERKQGARL